MKIHLPLLLALLASVASAEDETVVDGELGRALDLAVQQHTQGGFWGVVLVAKDGKVVLAKGYGNADYEKTPNTPRHLFEIASTSKMLTAIAILKLEMEGKLSTGDPITKFFRNVPAEKKAITVHQLLSHTSGESEEGLLPYQCDETADEMVKLAMARPLTSKPGTRFEYSNVGYALLAVIVEKASGETFEEYMRGHIFKPAGLKDTGFVQDSSLDAARATVRIDRDSKSPVGTALQWGWSWGYRGMGGVVTTAWDLFRLDRALRAQKILDAAALKKHATPVLADYGCGCLVQLTSSGRQKVSHNGSVSGYLCAYDRYVEDDCLIVIQGNHGSDFFGLEKRLEETLFPPPRIMISIDVKGRKLNAGGGLVLERGASWKAERSGDSVVLSLQTKDGAPARVTLPAGAASSLLKRVQESIEARKKSGEKDDGTMEAGVYTGGLALADGRGEIGPVELELMPAYRGVGSDGKETVDSRMCLVLRDSASGQWPLMAHMSLSAAGQMVKELKEALKK